MNEKVKQIFEVLGIEPEEEFKFRNNNSGIYKFDDKLYIYYLDQYDKDWRRSGIYIADIIKYGIIKIPQKLKLTNKDKIAIKFLKNCGFHYVAIAADNITFIYKEKPKFDLNCYDLLDYDGVVPYRFTFQKREDEPLCLDDFTDEDLKED